MNKTVIVVDDDRWAIADIRMSFNFEKWGFTLIGTYQSAREAWQAIQNQVPDLVVSDIRMGKESGLDLARWIRQENISTTFVLVSGYDDFEYVQQAFEFGVFYYLLKPLDDETVGKLMRRISDKLEKEPGKTDDFENVLDYVNLHFAEPITLSSTAQMMYFNKSYLAQLFSKKLNTTFTQYRNQLRVDKAKKAIQNGERNMTILATNCGFEGLSQFSRVFKQLEGVSPMQYIKKNET